MDPRHSSFPAIAHANNDPRNSRVDTIMQNKPTQPSTGSSVFDPASPVLLDYNFPYPASPQGSSTSGIDAPPEVRMGHSFASQAPALDLPSNNNIRAISSQHRASMTSIDSAFDPDMLGNINQWTPGQNGHLARSNSNSSPNKDTSGNELERRFVDDGKTPAWSDLKTKAGKERKRLPLACIACRRKKIRCSGEKPACKHCLKARVPCVYKITTRKAAPRTDYMAMLDKRLKRMEDRVIRIIPKDDMPDLNATGRSSVRPPLPGQVPKKDKSGLPNKRSAEEAFTVELTEWTSSRNTTNLLDATARLKSQRDGENKLFVDGTESLPPQHIQEHLAEVFFDCIYGQAYLLLHKPSFMRKLKAGTIPPVLMLAVCAISARFSTHPQLATEPAFLRGEQWATPARAIVEKRHFEPNITILTCMLILGLHYFGTCEGGLSWSFGGQAMRMGYALQLHRELEHDPQTRNQIDKSGDGSKEPPKAPVLSFTDREIRRRTMWACYLMDTFNASGSERPSFLNEDYFQIQLPIKESHFQMEVSGPTEDLEGNAPLTTSSSPLDIASDHKSNMGVAAYVIRAVVVWKRIVKYLNLGGKVKDPYPIWDPLSQFSALQRQISAIKSSLPDTLTYTSENLATHVSERLANQFLFLHIVLAQDLLFLHRFAIPTAPRTRRPYPPNTPKSFLASSATCVLENAAFISRLVSDSTGHTFTVPFAGYCTYSAATVHVWGIFSKNPALEAASKENLRHSYKYLTRMKRYWGMFHYMAESIKDSYRSFADAANRAPAMPAQLSATTNANPLAAISANASRQVSPSLDDNDSASPSSTAQTKPSAASTDPTSSSTQPAASSDRKSMFQYGDWFGKYPHGVSESEWESAHRQYRSENQGGTEAVMSQGSDLQSVEEFFATLSPPSKAAEMEKAMGIGIEGRGKKVPKRRGKSVADNPPAGAAGGQKGQGGSRTNSAAGVDAQQAQQQAQHGHTATIAHGQRRRSNMTDVPATELDLDDLTGIDIPMSGFDQQQTSLQRHLTSHPSASDFDLTSPTLYHQSQSTGGASQHPNQPIASPFSYNSPPGASTYNPNAFTFSAGVPHLDRQMVFGAYAGIGPSITANPSALNNLNSLNLSNPWDAIDMSGYAFADPMGIGGSNDGGNDPGGANPGSNFGAGMGIGMGISSSAWFMPFNIEPPSYVDGGFNMDDFGGGSMDLDGAASAGRGPGSFSTPNVGNGGQP